MIVMADFVGDEYFCFLVPFLLMLCLVTSDARSNDNDNDRIPKQITSWPLIGASYYIVCTRESRNQRSPIHPR